MNSKKKKQIKEFGLLAGGITLASIAVQNVNASSLFSINPLGTGEQIRTQLINNTDGELTDVMANTYRLEATCGEKGKANESKCGEKGKTKEHTCGEKK